MEQELSGQLEALAKQTKRLTERRADLDQRTEELEKEYTQRLERETGTLRDELAAKERAYEKRIALVQQQLEQTQAGASDVQGREAALRSQLDAAGEKIAAGQKELTRLSAELEEVNRDRARRGNLLKEQVRRYEQDLAEWQRKLDATTAQGSQAAGAASTEVSTIKQALAEARAELEQTRGRLAEAEAQKAAWEEKAGASDGKSRAGYGTQGADRDAREAADRSGRADLHGPGCNAASFGRRDARQERHGERTDRTAPPARGAGGREEVMAVHPPHPPFNAARIAGRRFGGRGGACPAGAGGASRKTPSAGADPPRAQASVA